MALTKLTTDVKNISKLSDTPPDSLTAAMIKAAFDKAGVDIKSFINNTLTAEVDSLVGTATLETVAQTLKSAINEIQHVTAAEVGIDDDVVSSVLAYSSGKIQNLFTDHLGYINVKNPPAGYQAALIDGTTDDTDAILALIAFGESAGCRNLFIPEGTCMIRATGTDTRGDELGGLIIPSGWHILMSNKTILKAINGTKQGYSILNIIDADNVKITGGHMLGERSTHIGSTGEWGFCIRISNSHDIILENVKCSESWGDGMLIRGDSSYNITVNDSIFTHNRRQGVTIGATATGIVKNIYFNRCEFSEQDGALPKAGVDIEGSDGSKYYRIYFHDCRFINNGYTALALADNCEEVFVMNCYFEGNVGCAISAALVSTQHNIVIKNNTIIGSELNEDTQLACISFKGVTTNLVVAYNDINGNDKYHGIAIGQNNDAIIGNNKIKNCYHGIFNTGNSNNVAITNNIIHDSESGVFLFGNLISSIVEKNNIYNITDYAGIQALLGKFTDCIVSNNIIHDCQLSGFYMSPIRSSFSGNIIKNCGLATANTYYGISVTSSIDECLFINNYIRGANMAVAIYGSATPTSGKGSIFTKNDCRGTFGTDEILLNATHINTDNYTE